MSEFSVLSDLYNRLFAVQISNPDLSVDYWVWNTIYAELPQGYTLPDMQIVQVLNQP
ncbi:hypothetical protein B5M42_004435 [Paenibacillus athensensis]|uniref:hypothetical protein n=1 Tax=Paenibacillus athensensis TaxID=1967502 RepID=UPI0014303AD5|nr:hypothetical protein [Paenibacillus athensensis]MCD1258086.1 hypothetical protein [Paenibacillus athensensis]